jgi:hypothetical protein
MLRALELAPNLKEVKLQRTRHRNPVAPLELKRFALEGDNSPGVPLASLKSLSLQDAGHLMLMKSTVLTEWRQYVNFARLERLGLRPALHQAAIETLTEYPTFDQGFDQLGRYCPLLEDLSIPIQRSKGDSQEVALYRALGSLKSLKYLDLWLDVSPTALY